MPRYIVEITDCTVTFENIHAEDPDAANAEAHELVARLSRDNMDCGFCVYANGITSAEPHPDGE